MDEVLNIPDQYSILATTARDESSIRVLKQGETFAVFDRQGDLGRAGSPELGLYHEGTRYLSRFELAIGHQPLLLLNSTMRKSFPVLTTDLTNPDMTINGELLLARGTLHLFRNKFLFEGACYERLQIFNYGTVRLRVSMTVDVDADYADVFEIRGTRRNRRGQRLDNQLTRHGLILRYRGLDAVLRHTDIYCDP